MKKILLVCFDNVGDLVFTSALARALQGDSSLAISLLCKDYTARLGQLLPGVHKVYAADPFWDKSPQRGRGPIRPFFRCLWALRKERFDAALIASTCWRTALLLRFVGGISILWGLLGRKNRYLLTRAFPKAGREEAVVGGLLKSFAAVLPQATVDPHSSLDPSRLPKRERPLILEGKRLVILHPFAGRADRCAPLDLWQQLALNLQGRGYHVLWTGTPGELQSIRSSPERWGAEHCLDSWADDLVQLAWFWAQAEFFIGHDSGPLHAAHALGVPVLGLYLPGEPKRTFPQGPAVSTMLFRKNPKDLTLADTLSSVRELETRIKEVYER